MSDDVVTQQTQNFLREKIALRAHSLWEQRGRPIGSPEGDWSRAEHEIRGEQAVDGEVVQARNKAVRAHRHTPKAGVVPPFSDHSGSL